MRILCMTRGFIEFMVDDMPKFKDVVFSINGESLAQGFWVQRCSLKVVDREDIQLTGIENITIENKILDYWNNSEKVYVEESKETLENFKLE